MRDFSELKLRTLDEVFGNASEIDQHPESSEKIQKVEENAEPEETYYQVKVKKTMSSHRARRLLSEQALEQELPWHFERGAAYHCISMGDVDALTYLRVIVKQQRVRYAILSTWCMAAEDIHEIDTWLDKGYIERIDFFCGEIFRGTYLKEYNDMKALCHKHGCKMSIFRNHSKVMVVFGERFDCVIESSANVNTNPRTEQTCITVDRDLAIFYKDFFDGIISFEREFDFVGKFEIDKETAGSRKGTSGRRKAAGKRGGKKQCGSSKTREKTKAAEIEGIPGKQGKAPPAKTVRGNRPK